MATVVNARDILLAATVPRTVTVDIPGTVGWPNVTDPAATRPADNADVTLAKINAGLSVTGGGLTLNAGGAIMGGQSGYATGTGWFLGYSGAAYKFSIGNASKFLQWDGAAMTFQGDLTGAGTINWTGPATFQGTTTGAVNCSVLVNPNATVAYGIYTVGTTAGIKADVSGVGGIAVWAGGGSQIGLQGDAGTGTALKLTLTGAGKLMMLPAAQFTTGAVTPVFNNKPGAGTTVKWIPVFDDAGAKWWVPAVKDV